MLARTHGAVVGTVIDRRSAFVSVGGSCAVRRRRRILCSVSRLNHGLSMTDATGFRNAAGRSAPEGLKRCSLRCASGNETGRATASPRYSGFAARATNHPAFLSGINVLGCHTVRP